MSMSMRSLLIRMRVMDAQMTLSRWYLGWDLYRAMPFPGMRGRGLHDKAKGLVEHDRELIRSMAELEGRSHG